jgi:hypothetical protein
MRTVALLVHPNGEIFAVTGLVKPQEPMHSGFIDEEREIMNNYHKKLKDYKKAVESATWCNQEIAKQVLLEQFPSRDMSSDKIEHYDVKNILLTELVTKRRRIFNVGEEVPCINASPLFGNHIGPPLKKGEVYKIIAITLDNQGNQHLDVGLKSEFSFITSYETGEELKDGNKIHWCHPTRFE